MQAKDQVKNGMTSSRVNVDDIRKGLGNACQQSSERPSDDSEEDNKPLASRVPAKRALELSAQDRKGDADDSDEDDDKPLVLKRVANGPSKSDNSQKILQKDANSKKSKIGALETREALRLGLSPSLSILYRKEIERARVFQREFFVALNPQTIHVADRECGKDRDRARAREREANRMWVCLRGTCTV